MVNRGPAFSAVLVIASLFVSLMAFSGASSFGVFLSPLREDFGWTTAVTSSAYSLLMFSYCALGIVCGSAVDRFGPRITVGFGGLFLGLGLLLTSQINTPWQIYLTYGALIGPGMSTSYSPLLTTISRWFTRRRGLALGIVLAGSGLSGLITPPLVSYLILIYGWRSSYVIMGMAAGSIIIAAAMFLNKAPIQTEISSDTKMPSDRNRGNIKRSDERDFSLRKALCTKTFWLLGLILFMVGFGLQMVLVHIIPHVQNNFRVSPMNAATVLSTIGAASIAGKLVMGAASDRIGKRAALAICALIEGMMIIGLLNSRLWMVYIIAGIYGFGYGGHVPQFPALMGEFFGLQRMGTILGAATIFYGLGAALGPFLGGHIFDTTGKYAGAFTLGAIAMFFAAGLTAFLKRPKLGKSWF
jgi:MFS family permease